MNQSTAVKAIQNFVRSLKGDKRTSISPFHAFVNRSKIINSSRLTIVAASIDRPGSLLTRTLSPVGIIIAELSDKSAPAHTKLDLGLGTAIEKQRSFNDVTHVFKANGVYELPFGPGKRWANWGGIAGKILGGWNINGLLRWQSGEPIAFVSARATLNRAGRSGLNTVNSTLSVQELQDRTGLFFDATGRPVLFDPTLRPALSNPTSPGFVGGLQLTPVSGPSVFFLDMSMIKRTNITEQVNLEFRAEAFNVLNHTAFDLTNAQQLQNINAGSFGQITTTSPPRIMQFGLKLIF